MLTAQQHERKAHRFVDGDGTKVDVVALGVIGTQAIVEFVREGGCLVYRMRRPVFEATFSPIGAPRMRERTNAVAQQNEIFKLAALPLAA